MWFSGVLCCFARRNYHSLGHFSWTLSFLLMLHLITRSLSGVLPLIVMAGTSIVLFSGCSVWNVLQLFQGPQWPPSHQSCITIHGRARRSLSFLLCCNMTSWNLKDKILGCNVFPSLIKHLSVLTNNHFPRTCLYSFKDRKKTFFNNSNWVMLREYSLCSLTLLWKDCM